MHPKTCPAYAPPPPPPNRPAPPACDDWPEPEPGQPTRQTAYTTAPASGVSFLWEVRRELRRCTWPSARDVEAHAVVTLGIILFFTLYSTMINALCGLLMRMVGG